MNKYRIAVIPGDGIGKEVVPEGIRVLEAAAAKFGIEFQWDEFPWSCDYYTRTGRMMPEDGLDQIRGHDAIFLGAVGFPGVPDHISLWGLLIRIRRGFEQYANIRPVRLMRGIESPLRGREAGDIDFIVVRENTEGEYSALGGRSFDGTDYEVVVQESIFTRRGVDRILRYAFEVAHVAATKLSEGPSQSFLADTFRLWSAENTGGFLSLGADWPRPVRTAVFGGTRPPKASSPVWPIT